MLDSAANLERSAIGLLQHSIHPSDTFDMLCQAIEKIDPWHPAPAGVVQLCAALAIVSPETLTEPIAARIAAVIARANVESVNQPGLDEAFQLLRLLLPTPAAKVMPDLLGPLCTGSATHPRWLTRASLLLSELVKWQPDIVSLESVIEIATTGREELSSAVTGLLEDQILSNPSRVMPEHIRRIVPDENASIRHRYLLNALENHPRTDDSVRAIARERIDQLFPLRERWFRLAGTRELNVLVVQNIADGQGDEIVRINALMQAFLDANDASRITLITDRSYLWDHPRLESISFDDGAGIDRILAARLDVVAEFYESQVTFLNHDPHVHNMIEELRTSTRWLLDVQAEKGWNRFTLNSVRIMGQEWSAALALNRPRVASVYDPVLRLLAELGLSLRLGTSHPAGAPVLWHKPVAEEAPRWDHLLSGTPDDRRVAMLNPFGGSGELKGFTADVLDDLVNLIAQLVASGYTVVLCPGSESWSSQSVAAQVTAMLPLDVRLHCRIAPAPRDDASLASWTRQTLACIQRADLIVTIEGWMVHAASALGKPFNVLMVSGSQSAQWMPWGRNAAQCYQLFQGREQPRKPPLPEQPRKHAWIELLSRMDSPAWHEVLKPVLASRDPDLRAAAARAVSRIKPDYGLSSLLRLLQDSSRVVRAEAANAILNSYSERDYDHDVPARDELVAYRLFDTSNPNRYAIYALGNRALPALQAALHDDDPTARRTAAACLEELAKRQASAYQPGESGLHQLVTPVVESLKSARTSR